MGKKQQKKHKNKVKTSVVLLLIINRNLFVMKQIQLFLYFSEQIARFISVIFTENRLGKGGLEKPVMDLFLLSKLSWGNFDPSPKQEQKRISKIEWKT